MRYIPLSYTKAANAAKLLQQIYSTAKAPQEEKQTPEETAASEDQTLAKIRSSLQASRVEDTTLVERLSRAISLVEASELTIVPDEEHNGLLIYTFSRNFPKILEMIGKLDLPTKMVFIEVFITQVSYDDDLELGVDWKYVGDLEFEDQTIPQTLWTDFKTERRVTSSVDSVGLNYQIISENLNAFLHAMMTSGKVEIISRPHLTTKDRIKAKITMGNDVPFLKKIVVSPEGVSSSSQVEYASVATTLEVTPEIHPDDFVTLEIIQSIDDISAETFQISRDFDPQIIVRRQANMSVRVKDGQTVCLGGFTGNKQVVNEDKVPLLGDIPLIGELFKYSKRQFIKTEMLIFITPHILENTQEMLNMTNAQRSMSIIKPNDAHHSNFLRPETELATPPYRDLEGRNGSSDLLINTIKTIQELEQELPVPQQPEPEVKQKPAPQAAPAPAAAPAAAPPAAQPQAQPATPPPAQPEKEKAAPPANPPAATPPAAEKPPEPAK